MSATMITSGAERRLAIEHWLLAAAPDRKRARAEWEERGFAMLPCGGLFAAVRIPALVVQAAVGSTGEAQVDAYLGDALLHGPVIFDRYAGRYYALVPASASRWWDVPGTVCLGLGSELGVPRPGVGAADRTRVCWSVPMEGPGELCSPSEVQALMRYGQERSGVESRGACRAPVQGMPLDTQSMRSAAERACDVESPASADLEGTIAALRAYAEVLVPEVRHLATRAPADDRTAMVALIGVEEGRRRLSTRTSTGDLHRVARKTAMSVIALCTHYENLARPPVS